MTTVISALLPCPEGLEARALYNSIVCQSNGGVPLAQRVGKVCLLVAKETANALLEQRYKAFDPIVKNFGCQINAAELAHLLQTSRNELCDEAKRLIGSIHQVESISLSEQKAIVQPLQSFLRPLDIKVSKEMARFLRARLLCIVNRDIEKEGHAVPITDVNLLCKKVGSKPKGIQKALQCLLDGLQTEESLLATRFVAAKSELLPDDPRKEMIKRSVLLVRESAVKTSRKLQSPIVSIPLLHNTEVCLRTFNGIVCVKNKLLFCDRPIAEALPKKVFIKMPEEQLIDISLCREEEPVIVVEGYIDNKTDLKNRIMQVGFMNMVRANCAPLPQYASGASKEPIEYAEAEEDVVRYKSDQYLDAKNVVVIDHIFCSSIKEERDDKAA